MTFALVKLMTHPDEIVEEKHLPSLLAASNLKKEQKSRIETNLIKVFMVSSKITADDGIHTLRSNPYVSIR